MTYEELREALMTGCCLENERQTHHRGRRTGEAGCRMDGTGLCIWRTMPTGKFIIFKLALGIHARLSAQGAVGPLRHLA